ncbi:MAG: Crp/Fnr family transcriptional regulator [Usitatibacter sp.]
MPTVLTNRLLAALPAAELKRLHANLELVQMPVGEVLYESGRSLNHVFFPTSCIVSLLHVLENGASSELAVVGNDGVVGVSIFMGGLSTPSRAVVQSLGEAYRLPARLVMEEFSRGGAVQHLMLRYTQALLTQMAQTAVCNRHHSVDQQLCRWLLLTIDRLPTAEIITTQELISNMLGVRREGVTEAAGKLQKLGVITYRRGHIEVLDRPRLETMSCECYDVVRRETERLLPVPSKAPKAPRMAIPVRPRSYEQRS